jgi:hypothetical protein
MVEDRELPARGTVAAIAYIKPKTNRNKGYFSVEVHINIYSK